MDRITGQALIILLTILLIICANSTNIYAMTLEYDGQVHEYTAKPIKLVVNGDTVNGEILPILLNDRTMVPAREVFEKLGATVKWEEKHKQVYVRYGSKNIILEINNKTAYINQIANELDVPAKLINSKTMIPAAFVARNLGFEVSWNERTRTVDIRDEDFVEENNDKTILGYATYYYKGDKNSYNSLISNKDVLDQVITHTYSADGKGNLSGLISLEQIKFAKDNNIKLQASVTNQFDIKIAKELLESSVNRKNLINNIIAEIKKYGYDGICIDIEHVYPSNRTHMTLLMKELYETLQPKGYSVTIALPAKTYDDKIGTWSGAFDYVALAPYADQFVIMTYDEHYPQGAPGPIASAGWVEKVAKYAASVLPQEKILLGLAAYGYDWSENNSTKAYTSKKAQLIADNNKAIVHWDEKAQAPYYKYITAQGEKHEVWFENENSIIAKLNIVKDYDLQGVSIWSLGSETPAYMAQIETTLK